MKGFRTYPPLVWVGLVVLVGASLLFTDPTLALLLYIGALGLPLARNAYLNPLSRPRSPYLQWLKTMPYSPDKRLPNGSPTPGLHDAVFIAIYCIAFIRINVEPFILAMLIVGAVCVYLGTFSLSVARQLLNLGPQWLGYFILIILLLSFSSIKLFAISGYNSRVLVLPMMIVFLVFVTAVIGLKMMLNRYPWGGTELVQSALLDNRPLKELIYGQGRVQELGQPITSLNPKASWPRLPSVHVWGLSLLAATLDLLVLIFAPESAGGMFLMMTVPITIARALVYYGSRCVAFPAWGLVPDHAMRNILWNRRLSVSILILTAMIAGWTLFVITLPETAAIILDPIATLLFCVAAFRLPPSRATWETTGLSEIDMRVAPVRAKSRHVGTSEN